MKGRMPYALRVEVSVGVLGAVPHGEALLEAGGVEDLDLVAALLQGLHAAVIKGSRLKDLNDGGRIERFFGEEETEGK